MIKKIFLLSNGQKQLRSRPIAISAESRKRRASAAIVDDGTFNGWKFKATEAKRRSKFQSEYSAGRNFKSVEGQADIKWTHKKPYTSIARIRGHKGQSGLTDLVKQTVAESMFRLFKLLQHRQVVLMFNRWFSKYFLGTFFLF